MSERPKILTVGETGTVGRGLNKALKNSEFELYAGTQVESDLIIDEGFKYFDLLNPQSMEETIKKGDFDVIVNLAGVANPSYASDKNSKAWDINCYGVLKMLEIVSNMPIGKRPKIILPMSVLQFDIKQSGIIDINHPLKQQGNDYVLQKNTLLSEAQKYRKDVDIYFAFLANVTGYAHPRGYFGPDIMRQLVEGEKIITHGDLDQLKPFLGSEDAGRILGCAIRNTGHHGLLTVGKSFFVASGTNYNMREFVGVMKEVANRNDAEISNENDPRLGGKATVSEIKFNIELLTKMGYKELGNMQTIAKALYAEALRVKNKQCLPARGIPDEIK
jgi:nucleoside-diphosphate-sugar epimerase